jgi:hypothetical protein
MCQSAAGNSQVKRPLKFETHNERNKMQMPDMIPSQSSQIASFGYDANSQTLHVTFKRGGHYSYSGVPTEKLERMKAADSHGGFLHSEIKPHHPFTKHS